MSAVVLALASSLAYGTADFAGGLLSRRAHFALVALVAEAVAATATLAAVLVTSSAVPAAGALAWGVLGGLGNGLALMALHRGLGRGRMHVVAPLSAVGAAAAGVVDGLVTGAGFATLFIALDRASAVAGLWPTAAAQTTSLVVIAAVTIILQRRSGLGTITARTAAAAGVVGLLSATAVVLYSLAAAQGQLAIVAVMAALYPAVTVVLAITILRKRASTTQRLGMATALLAVVLVATP